MAQLAFAGIPSVVLMVLLPVLIVRERTRMGGRYDKFFILAASAHDGPWPWFDLHEALRLSGGTVQERRAYANQVVGAYESLRHKANLPVPDASARYMQRLLRELVFTPDWILKGESDFIRQHVWQCEHLALCSEFSRFRMLHPGDRTAWTEHAMDMVLDEPPPCGDIESFMSDWLTFKRAV